MSSRATLCAIVAAALGCATTGTNPHDMSVAEHEQAARQEDDKAARHRAQYDRDAWRTDGTACSTYCFNTWSNPTSEHAREARQRRVAAAKHRSASQALRDAEARGCDGIPERDRDVSPFFHVQDIEKIERVAEDDASATYLIWFSPVGGLDAPGMQTLLDCHLARNAVLGHEAKDMDYCPLVPANVKASAEQREAGLRVRVEVRDGDSVAAVRDRIRVLEARLAERLPATERK